MGFCSKLYFGMIRCGIMWALGFRYQHSAVNVTVYFVCPCRSSWQRIEAINCTHPLIYYNRHHIFVSICVYICIHMTILCAFSCISCVCVCCTMSNLYTNLARPDKLFSMSTQYAKRTETGIREKKTIWFPTIFRIDQCGHLNAE